MSDPLKKVSQLNSQSLLYPSRWDFHQQKLFKSNKQSCSNSIIHENIMYDTQNTVNEQFCNTALRFLNIWKIYDHLQNLFLAIEDMIKKKLALISNSMCMRFYLCTKINNHLTKRFHISHNFIRCKNFYLKKVSTSDLV